MSSEEIVCPLCDQPPENVTRPSRSRPDTLEIHCTWCGVYWIDGLAALDLQSEPARSKRWILSAISVNADGDTLLIEPDNIATLIASARLPRSPLDVIDRLIDHAASKHGEGGSFSQTVLVPMRDNLRYFLQSGGDLKFVLNSAASLGWITLKQTPDGTKWKVKLTADGWRRAADLRTTLPRSDQAFVAMRFAAQMEPAFAAMERALKATGYRALKIDLEEHNDAIMDRVIAEIRRSMFVVADVTHHRNGVYYEGGFARGLGIPVIWCCHAEHFDDRHFDIQHLSAIKWENEQELHDKLLQRVRATAPVRAPLT